MLITGLSNLSEGTWGTVLHSLSSHNASQSHNLFFSYPTQTLLHDRVSVSPLSASHRSKPRTFLSAFFLIQSAIGMSYNPVS
eukprot:14707_6